MGMRRYFTEHPASVGESYGEHFRVAVHFARELTAAAAACAVHAVVPSLCTTSASTRIRRLHDEMTAGPRGAAVRALSAPPNAA
jgi:Family of unknown function (DUF6356)